MVFYLVPFGVALVLLAAHEVRRRGARLTSAAAKVADGFERWAEPMLPRAVGTMTMIGGVVLLVSGATPSVRGRLAWLVDVFPLGVVELSHFAGSIAGAALLPDSLARIRAADPATLPLVEGSPRIGACVGAVGKFVCVGLNYSDHAAESGLPLARVGGLVRLAGKLRALKGQDLEEGVSTRLVVYAASLIAHGMSVERAIRVAMIEPLTDDDDVRRGLLDLVTAVLG